jgi:hypothetical protein
MRKHGAGVYIWRADKPGSVTAGLLRRAGIKIRIPFLMTHFAYVGETKSLRHRERQHRGNEGTGDAFEQRGKPWIDLNARIVFFLPLPRWKWLLRTVETLFILLTWPVYNHAKNLWNPRRIPLNVQHRQRRARNGRSLPVSVNFRPYHTIIILALIVGAAKIGDML